MNKKSLKTVYCTAFAAAELILWVLVVTIDGADAVNTLCYCSVLLAFLFSLSWLKRGVNSVVISVALFFTACADYCLVIDLTAPYELALVFFSVVQISYCVLLYINQTTCQRKIHLIVRGAVIVVALAVTEAVLKGKADFLSLITIFYFSNLVCNFAFSCVQFKTYAMFAVGLLCFIGCDLLVGLGYAQGVYFDLPVGSFLYNVTHTDFNLIWTFYIPSQTLISLTSAVLPTRKKRN